MELNDANAFSNLGSYYYIGNYGLQQNNAKALELWHRAAELGNADAYYNIGIAYSNGYGVERDKKKAVYYYELSAMSGIAQARHNLGVGEAKAGNWDRALKHWMIAAVVGYTDSLKNVKQLHMNGHATKDDYAKALHSYQAYLHEIKTDQRDEAAASYDDCEYY